MENFKTMFYKVKGKAIKHAPEIEIALAIIAEAVAIVTACRATMKAQDVLAEAKDNVQKVHEEQEKLTAETETTKENTEADTTLPEKNVKALTKVYAHTGLELAKLYAIPVTCFAASTFLMIKSDKTSHERFLAASAALEASREAFNKYRERVKMQFGEEVDTQLVRGEHEELVGHQETDENGEEKTVVETLKTLDPANEYTVLFDENTTDAYDKNGEYNRTFLLAQMKIANQRLYTRHYLFLNEVYDMIGYQATSDERKMGQIVGWYYDKDNTNPKCHNFVDFGLNADNAPCMEEPAVWLTFNCDGNILNML